MLILCSIRWFLTVYLEPEQWSHLALVSMNSLQILNQIIQLALSVKVLKSIVTHFLMSGPLFKVDCCHSRESSPVKKVDLKNNTL